MLRSRLAEVSSEIRAVIGEVNLPVGFAEAISESLTLDGRVLAVEPFAYWSRLVLAAAEAAGLHDWRQAVPAAAAAELTVASFELLDDIQDADPNPILSRLGIPQGLNIAIGLLVLGQRALLRLPGRGVEPEVALDVQRELTSAIAIAGGGQYLDLATEGRSRAVEEASGSADELDALELAGRKTAALVAGACRVGGRLGTSDPHILDILGRFGWHAGLADQLQNDLDALSVERPKSDRLRGKLTLPAVAADAFGAAARREAGQTGDAVRQMALADSSALHYTWVVMDSHRQQAKVIVGELGSPHPSEGLLDLL